ncbi:LacI family DNA-binding transcriptional regulator [Oceanihabitans sp. 2_MG-2023]|uniref:LacI family DNA-binding transcriptional regulator n=1 Tax=Oceanihabitans sp. 2_MG-2023 TaxID=3062661 RepID=UPI0026E22FDD|nr:LacI family DNA-binding transcriptional regulator [Oceanihabitans sp. 2_MG-2023]MDO6596552.1 LacI family DNA-binding transcriptional regulator [Oceanihabitans sp. 2_MG-2023]
MITLKDLAEKLNVSVSTVSKALHDNPEISADTIKRVKEVAKLYNYQPNKIAQSLKANQTKTFGVIIPSLLNRFFAKVLFGIEKEAREKGYNIITCMSNEKLDKEKECIQLLSNGSVDGFIIAVSEETQKTKDYSHFKATQLAKIPIVMFDRVIDEFNCDKVIIDDFEEAKKLTLKLLKQGKKNIAFISTINDLNVGNLRREGYENAMKENINLLFIDTNKDIQQQIKTFLVNNKHVDAIIAADNISGTIVISVANHLGYKIPKELSIIGFADEQISNLSVPKLSYLNQNAQQMGKRAIHLMINRLKDKTITKEFITEKIITTFAKQESF